MKMGSCPDFSWSAAARPSPPTRQMGEHEPHRMRRDHTRTPCALHHKVAKVAYGDFDAFTRESNASGI